MSEFSPFRSAWQAKHPTSGVLTILNLLLVDIGKGEGTVAEGQGTDVLKGRDDD
jgi:hypothetical protein